MSYIHADMDAIVRLANTIDQYESDVKRLQQDINERFKQLEAEGKWADDKYRTFSDTQMAKLNDDIQYLHQVIENELKPFLQDYYQRLRAYQESW
ncbi:MAG: hypothetical protein D3916_08105 [Candidatus Electrothrix sp. MAN1_4]|nr:hypothetical protein [Candidatus Electrothrix sp. MAN1_4]